MMLTNQTVVKIGVTKTDLIYQVEAIEQGWLYSCWPNETRRLAYAMWKKRMEQNNSK